MASGAMDAVGDSHLGACHCGAVQFRVRLIDGLRSARRCTCSLCRMRGAVTVSAWVRDIEIIQGADHLGLYQFHSMTARHYFCKTCGIYTHHQRRSDPRQLGINVACLAGLSPFDFAEVVVEDGTRHASDTGVKAGIAGVLRFDALAQVAAAGQRPEAE